MILMIKIFFFFLNIAYCKSIRQNEETNFLASECEEYGINENEKIYQMNHFYIGLQSEDQFRNTDLLVFNYNLIEKVNEYPYLNSNVQIINTISVLLENQKNDICTLFLNIDLQLYMINCIEEFLNYDISSLNINKQYQIRIQTEFNYTFCNQLSYFQNNFYVSCNHSNYYHILSISRKNHTIKHLVIEFNQSSQCLMKYLNFENSITYSLYCCYDWGVYSLDQEGLSHSIIDYSYFGSMVGQKESYLINVKVLQEQNLLLMFPDQIYNFKQDYLEGSLFKIFQYVESNGFFKQNICKNFTQFTESYLNLHYTRNIMLINQYFLDDQNSVPLKGQLYFMEMEGGVLIFNNKKIIFLISQRMKQDIKLDIQEIVLLKNSKYFIGLSDKGSLQLLLIQYPFSYYPHRPNLQDKYIVTYQYSSKFQIQKDKCFFIKKINNDVNFTIQFDHRYFHQLFFFQSQNNNKILVPKSVFQSNLPYTMFIKEQPISNVVLKDYEDVELTCQFRRYIDNYNGFIQIYDQTIERRFVLFEGENKFLTIFDCQELKLQKFNYFIELDETKIKQIGDTIYILNRSGKQLYSIKFSNENIQFQFLFLFTKKMQFKIQQVFQYIQAIPLQAQEDDNSSEIFLIKNIISTTIIERFYFQELLQQPQNIIFFRDTTYFIQYNNSVQFVTLNKTFQILPLSLDILEVNCNFDFFSQINCILTALTKDGEQLQNYLVTKYDYTLLSTYKFDQFRPIKPLKYSANKDNLLIATKSSLSRIYYLFLFQYSKNQHILLKSIIETQELFFQLTNFGVYYYGIEHKIRVQNLNYYTFNFLNVDDSILSQKINVNLEFKSLVNNQVNFTQNITYFVSCSQAKLGQKQTNQPKLKLENNKAEVFIRKYIKGDIENMNLINSSNFVLEIPIQIMQSFNCQFLIDKFCLQVDLKNNSNFILSIVGDHVTKYLFENQQIEQILAIKQISDQNSIFVIKKDISTNLLIANYKILDNDLSLQWLNQIEMPTSLKSINVVQNIIIINLPESLKLIYYIAEQKIIAINNKGLIFQDIFYLFDTIYSLFIYDLTNLNIQFFQFENDQSVELKSFKITNEDIEQILFDQFEFPLKLNFFNVTIIDLKFNKEFQFAEFKVILFDTTNFILSVKVTCFIRQKELNIEILNIKKCNTQNSLYLKSVILLQPNHLIIFNYQYSLNIYHFQQDIYTTYPFYSNKSNYSQVLALNTTHFALIRRLEEIVMIDIATTQEWLLIYKGQQKQDLTETLQIQIVSPLQDEIIFELQLFDQS